MDEIDPDYLTTSFSPIDPGQIAFRLPEGEQFVGVGVATLFESMKDRARPHLGAWHDLTGVQLQGGVDLRPLLKKTQVSGVQYLNFGVWVRRDERLELRTGWTRFESANILTGALTLEPTRRESVQIRVVTEDGQAVPGALVAVDRGTLLNVGLISYLGYTGSDGTLTISGLETKRDWVVRLPDGAGPFRSEVSAKFETPRLDPVQLTVKGMTGKWSFVRHHVHFPIPGGSTRIEKLEAPAGGLSRALPVNSWIGPGRGPWTPFYLAYQNLGLDAEGSGALTLQFKNGTSIEVKDFRVSSNFHLRAEPKPGTASTNRPSRKPRNPVKSPK